MKRLLFFFLLLISVSGYAQELELAKQYFNNGTYDKALVIYETLYKENSRNTKIINGLVETYQQLENYNAAELVLKDAIKKQKNPIHLIALGYNYNYKKDTSAAKKYYLKAIAFISEKPIYATSIAAKFEQLALLDEAVLAYQKAMEIAPDLNLNFNLAKIYGQQGKIEKMFTTYLDYLVLNPKYLTTTKRAFSDYISEDKTQDNNAILRRVLLKKAQQEPNILYNDLLSWLFIQQKEYKKAFIQEKAIYVREKENFNRIESLAKLVQKEKNYSLATDMYQFIIEKSAFPEEILDAKTALLHIETLQATRKDYPVIEKKYVALLEAYGITTTTVFLQLEYAHFLAFYANQSKTAEQLLKNALDLPLSLYQQAEVKLELGAILVLQEKFNQALIYFAQVQHHKLKNSTYSQEARFRVAKTSYFKNDFSWAESQLQILKSSTSQLIANDALELLLLIRDNKVEDSTQTALKSYAKADLLAYQNKNDQAISLLNEILKAYTTESIVDQALFKQAELFEIKKDYPKAATNYLKIIANFNDDILADDALFNLAELYYNQLHQPEKAKQYYEKIIFNHEDSIYFVEARKKYRMLRGDTIN